MAPTEIVTLSGPHALHALARAFQQFENFDRFVAALEGALPRAAGWAEARIVLDRSLVAEAERFSPGLLSLPLSDGPAAAGLLRVGGGGERRLFGAEDLHLLAGLADFLGAVLTQARRVQDATRGRELLRLLLNQVPVGVAAYGFDRRPIVANEVALRWLGGNPLPFEEIEAGAESFYLRAEGKLVYGEVRRVDDLPSGAWMFVLHDLTPEQARLLEGLQREIFRALAEQRPCGVALLEVADRRHGALRRLPALRAALEPGELAGPYDATRVAVVLGAGGLELRARLRRLRAVVQDLPGVRLGLAELGRDGRTPEALLHAALQRHGEIDGALRPALLIHGENPAVAETLQMVLGRDYQVCASQELEQTRRWLSTRSFEGLVIELDAGRDGVESEPVVRLARELQPGIRTLYTTVQPATEIEVEPGAFVIEKPFDVASLSARVRALLG
jgi:PAS domain-containing protein